MFKRLMARLLGRKTAGFTVGYIYGDKYKPLRDTEYLTKLHGYPPSVQRRRLYYYPEERELLEKRSKEITGEPDDLIDRAATS